MVSSPFCALSVAKGMVITMKKIVSFFLCIAMCCTLFTTAFASDASTTADADATTSGYVDHRNDPGVEVQILDGRLRGTSPPSSNSFWDLSPSGDHGGLYVADLQKVKAGYLYTNKCFKPNEEGELNVSYDVVTNGVYGSMRIGLYDLSQGKIVATYDTDSFGIDGVSDSMYFYNLSTTTKYAVAFQGLRAGAGSIPTISGTANITW